MSEDLGSAHGSVVINTVPALAALAALRRQNAATVGSLNTLGRAAIVAGTGLVAVGAAIVGVFALAVKKAAEIDKKISYIAGITNVSTQEMGELRKVIIKLGQDSAYTAAEVADGFTELAKAGATNEQMIGGLGKAMITLGQAADIPLDKAASALVSISSTFNLTAKESTRIANVMSGAANASIISVEDMAISFKYAGGVAANLGVSLEDTATAIAILGNAGIRGSTAGTSLRRIFLQLTPRTEKAAAAMKELGIITKDGSNQFYDAKGNAKSLSEITEILRTSTAGLTAEMRQKAFATIFGDRAINSAIALAKGGSTEFARMKAVLGDTTAEEVAAKRLDNLAGSWEILKGTIDSALINAGTPAQKPLQQLVETITKLVNIFNGLSPAMQTNIVRFALLAAAVFLIAGSFLIFFGTLLRAYALFRQLAGAFRILFPLFKQFITLMRLMSLSLLTNPVFLIIAALVLLGIGFVILYKKSEKFRNAIHAMGRGFMWVFNWVKDNWKKLVPLLFGPLGIVYMLFKKFQKQIVGFFKAILDWLKNNWDLFLPLFFGPLGVVLLLVHRFHKQIIGFFQMMGSMIMSAVRTSLGAIVQFFQDLPRNLGFLIGFLIGFLVRIWWESMSFIVTSVRDGVMAIVNFFIALPGNIRDAAVAVYNTLVSWGISLWTTARDTGARVYHGIIDFFQLLPGRIANFCVAIFNRVRNWGISLVNNARTTGANFLNGVVSFFQRLPGRVQDFVTRTYNQVVAIGARIVAAGRDWGARLFNAVVGAIQGLPGRMGGILNRVIDAFTGLIQRGFDAARNFAGGLWDGFKSGLGINSPSFIEKQLFQIQAVGDDTIGTLGRQVKTLQRLASGVPDLNAEAAAARALYGSPSASARAASDAVTSASSMEKPAVSIVVNNPIDEKTSVTAVKVVNRLALLGA